MADEIITNVIPNMKAVDLGDGTFAYATVTETAQDRGIATGGSNVTCIDTTKAWIVNHFIGDALEVTVAGVEYHSLITANTANTITMNVIGAVVVAGNPYKIISAVGAASTIADGADVTQGAIADAVVAVGAAGTLSAKLRRLTTDLGAAVVDLAALEILVTAGNVDLAAIELINTDIETAVQGTEADIGFMRNVPVTTNTTGVGAAIATLSPGAAFQLVQVRFNVSTGAPLAAAETLTVTADINAGAAYDIILYNQDLGTTGINDVIIEFGEGYEFVAADDIVIALSANVGGDTWGCQTIHRLI